MSATEVIEQIERLPLAEQKKVFAYVEANYQAQSAILRDASVATGVRYLNRGRAREISAGVFKDNDELFRKLAQ